MEWVKYIEIWIHFWREGLFLAGFFEAFAQQQRNSAGADSTCRRSAPSKAQCTHPWPRSQSWPGKASIFTMQWRGMPEIGQTPSLRMSNQSKQYVYIHIYIYIYDVYMHSMLWTYNKQHLSFSHKKGLRWSRQKSNFKCLQMLVFTFDRAAGGKPHELPQQNSPWKNAMFQGHGMGCCSPTELFL